MTARFNKAFKASLIAHGTVIAVLLVFPLLRRWIKPEPPKEQITFIELIQPAPEAPVPKIVQPTPEPEPEPEPPKPEPEPPKPDPIPEPIKEPVPKPVVKEVKKKEIKVNTNKIVRAKQPKVETKPKLSEAELRKLLSSDLPVSATAASSTGTPTEMSLYYGKIYKILDAAWTKPPGVAGLSTDVKIRIAKNGAITRDPEIVGKSGNDAMDASVMNAVRSVASFPPLPISISKPYIDVTIKFESTDLPR